LRIEVNVNKREDDPRIEIYAREWSEELQQMMQNLKAFVSETKLYGQKEDEIYPLEIDKIIHIYSENNYIFAENDNDRFRLQLRLYELEEMLPKQFVRISQSEIINIHYIHKLKQEVNGFIKIYFKNGKITHSSRRYLKRIKEVLQL